VKLFDRFSSMRGHSPDVCEISIFVEDREKAWASSLAKASPITATKARMGFSSLACTMESAPRLRDEIANTTSVIAKRSWRECVMVVWDSAADNL
jgi:hypothetical protein